VEESELAQVSDLLVLIEDLSSTISMVTLTIASPAHSGLDLPVRHEGPHSSFSVIKPVTPELAAVAPQTQRHALGGSISLSRLVTAVSAATVLLAQHLDNDSGALSPLLLQVTRVRVLWPETDNADLGNPAVDVAMDDAELVCSLGRVPMQEAKGNTHGLGVSGTEVANANLNEIVTDDSLSSPPR